MSNLDPVSIERINGLHPKIRKATLDAYTAVSEYFAGKRIRVRVVQGYRTWAEQQALYDQGRTKPGKKVTNAKPGSSFHNYGLAIDFAILYDKDNNGTFETLSWDEKKDFDVNKKADWTEVAAIFEKHGFSWGGRWRTFTDLPHVEMTFGKTWKQLQALYEQKKFILGTTYVDF